MTMQRQCCLVLHVNYVVNHHLVVIWEIKEALFSGKGLKIYTHLHHIQTPQISNSKSNPDRMTSKQLEQIVL